MRAVFTSTLLLAAAAWAQWSPQSIGTTQPLLALHFHGRDTGYVAGGAGILRTLNGGAIWSLVSSGNGTLSALCFTDALHGYAAGGHTLLKTTDAGATWTSESWPAPTESNLISYQLNALECSPSGTVYAAGGKTLLTTSSTTPYSILIKSANGGAWQQVTSNLGIQIYSLHLLGGTSLLSGGGGYLSSSSSYPGGVYKTTNEGSAWQQVLNGTKSITSGTSGMGSSFSFTDASTGYATLRKLTDPPLYGIYKTTDAGETWTRIQAASASLRSVSMAGNTGWATGDNGVIFKLRAGTSLGTQASGTSDTLRAVYAIDSSTAWIAGDNGILLKTSNGGGTVTALRDGTLPEGHAPLATFTRTGSVLHFTFSRTVKFRALLFNTAGRILLRTPEETVFAGTHSLDLARLDMGSGLCVLRLEVDGVSRDYRVLLP